MEVRDDLSVEWRDSNREVGHELFRRQHHRNRSEAVLADLGKGRAGGATFDFSHV